MLQLISARLVIELSPHHLAFAGTVTLSPATFMTVIRDVVTSLHTHGRRLAVLMTITWTLLFLAWWALGIPLGPGAPVR